MMELSLKTIIGLIVVGILRLVDEMAKQRINSVKKTPKLIL